MAKTPPAFGMYKEQEDTPYVSHARNLMERGYKGLEQYTPKVNTMDSKVQADIDSRLGSIYNRAKEDFGINYKDTMGKMMANQYGNVGTTGSTAGLYRTDLANRTAQRELADLAYNKAQAYEGNVDRELSRRYNTIDMYNKLYGYGAIPQKYDDQNYKLSLTNQDRTYQNDFNEWKKDQQLQQALTNSGMDALGFALAPFTAGGSLALSSALQGSVNGLMTPNADMTYNGHTGWGTALGVGDTSGSGYQNWGKASTGMSQEEIGALMGGTMFGQNIMMRNPALKKSLSGSKSSSNNNVSNEDIIQLLMRLLGGGQ